MLLLTKSNASHVVGKFIKFTDNTILAHIQMHLHTDLAEEKKNSIQRTSLITCP